MNPPELLTDDELTDAGIALSKHRRMSGHPAAKNRSAESPPQTGLTANDGAVLATYNRFYPPPSAVAHMPLRFNSLIDDVLRSGPGDL